MKKGFFFSVFSIGLICLGSMGAIERAYNSDVNDITYQETSGDVNSSSSDEPTTQSTNYESPNTFALGLIDFSATNVTSDSVTLDWTIDMGDAQSIDKIEIAYGMPGYTFNKFNTGSTSLIGSYEINGLDPNTLYDAYLIVTWTDSLGSEQTTNSNTVSFTTLDAIPLSIIDFTVTNVTSNSATLDWTLDKGDAKVIEDVELSYTDPVNGPQTISTGYDSTAGSYTITDLTPLTLYDVTLIVSWTDYLSTWQTTTDTVSFTTLDPIGLSLIDFNASNVTNNSAKLNWNLDMGDAQSIDKIELSYTDPVNGLQTIDTGLVSPQGSYEINGLTPGTLYNVTLIVSWTDFFGDPQTTTDHTSFITANKTGLSVIDFTVSDITETNATLSWNLDMGDAQSIDKIELSYTDPVNGLQTIDTGSVLASDSYTLTGLTPDTLYDVTLIVSWTDYLGVQQTTNSDVVSFTTSYKELEIVSTNIQADESTNQAVVSWEIESNDSTIENIVVTNSNNEVLAEGSTDAIGSYTIDSSNEENYDWNIIVTYISPSGTQTTSNEAITNVVVNANNEVPIFEIVSGTLGIIFVIAIICLIYFINKYKKNIYSFETNETQIDWEALNNETQIDTEPFDNETQINSWM